MDLGQFYSLIYGRSKFAMNFASEIIEITEFKVGTCQRHRGIQIIQNNLAFGSLSNNRPTQTKPNHHLLAVKERISSCVQQLGLLHNKYICFTCIALVTFLVKFSRLFRVVCLIPNAVTMTVLRIPFLIFMIHHQAIFTKGHYRVFL